MSRRYGAQLEDDSEPEGAKHTSARSPQTKTQDSEADHPTRRHNFCICDPIVPKMNPCIYSCHYNMYKPHPQRLLAVMTLDACITGLQRQLTFSTSD